MKHCTVLMCAAVVAGSLLLSSSLLATSAPFAAEQAVVDRLMAEALLPETRSQALGELTKIVEARKQYDIYQREMYVELRSYAVGRMADLPIPELKEYFLQITADRFGIGFPHKLRAAAFRAYWKLRVSLVQDPVEQRRLLIQALDDQFEGFTADGWAAMELCNRGVTDAFDAIVRVIKKKSGSSRGDEQVRLCRMKMDQLAAHPTRFDALASVLRTVDPLEERRFITWAIHELAALATEESRTELAAYILRLQKDQRLERDSFLYYWPFELLRAAGWTDKKFKEMGIRPMYWS